MSRRFLGCKAFLLPFIRGTLEELAGPFESVLDPFAGTGAVAAVFNDRGCAVTAIDLLESNRVCLNAFLGPDPMRRPELARALAAMNALEPVPGYAAREFGGRYFAPEQAARIDAARDWIEADFEPGRLKDCLVAAVLLGADRIALTCGHYDAYRRGARPEPGRLDFPALDLPSDRANRDNLVLRGRAEELAADLPVDLAYLDPPYNSRQYADLYHVLENIAVWAKPPVYGVARKMDSSHLRSRFNGAHAAAAMAELVNDLDCRVIAVSYSNMGVKGDKRSNAAIRDVELEAILATRGPVTVHRSSFRPFSAGLRSIAGHEERLFVCLVEDSRPRCPTASRRRPAIPPHCRSAPSSRATAAA